MILETKNIVFNYVNDIIKFWILNRNNADKSLFF